jgi:hypothetical protein
MEANPLPFPPGESPFRCRGNIYLGGCEFYDHAVPGGHQAVAAALPPPLAQFFGQRFLESAWYDILPIVAISEAAASLRGKPYEDTVRDNARFVATRDLHGVLKQLLIKIASAEMVAMRLPRASLRYFDFGEADAQMLGPGQARSHQTGIPRQLGAWFLLCVEGFCEVAMGEAGVKDLRVHAHSLRSEGSRFGVETVTLTVDFTWSVR